MSREIDEKVVEMRFDNKQFESATKETLGTLDRLKQALKLPNLKDSLSGIDEAAKKTKLDGIASAVEALENRFSTLGIVGMRVIENLTDTVMRKLQTALSFVSDSIVSGGIRRAMNIENAHFQLQALLKDEVKVQAVMADAMESVDGTAYAYDEAAKAASQFAASGVQAGDDMLNALKGITGVAAMTNSSFEDISRVFTTVAGNGRLMGDQLLQLSSRGLNAASTIVDYFKEVQGQANITESEIREMVSKGEISFKTFSDAMTWAFGDSAKRANETFTGAFSNMKSALARIGAEFISPFIEQNSDMVKLFNALRVQINNVKSALTFNEQRSAIAGLTKESNLMLQTVSQLTKDGTMDFTEFTSEIIGTTKTEKELADINKKLSDSYEKVRESGSASVETLVEFNQNGVDATNNLQKYINGVLDGTIKVSQETKKSIQELTDGLHVSSSDILQFAQDGKLTFDIFTDAIVNASGAISNESKLASEAITNLLKNVEDSGSVTFETLKEFNKNGIDATKALLTYMNGVQDGSIRASYATTKAIEDITGGTKLLQYQVNNLAKEGAISYDIFQSALENMYGTEKALSKQFTEFVLDNVKQLIRYVQNADLSKPIEVLYHAVEIAKNTFKGLYSVIKPVTEALSETFSVSIDDVLNLSSKLEEISSKMKLSEKNSTNLKNAFKGVFDIIKLLRDGFISLLKAIIPVNAPLLNIGDSVLDLAGNIGLGLTKFSEWARTSSEVSKAIDFLKSGIQALINVVSNASSYFASFVDEIKKISIVQSIIDTLHFGLEAINKALEHLQTKVKPLSGISSFFKNFLKWLGSGTIAIIQGIASAVSSLFKVISEMVRTVDASTFFGFLNSGLISGIGVLIIKFFNDFKKVMGGVKKESSGLMKSIEGIFSNLNKSLVELQTSVKAKALKTIAESVLILAGSLIVISLIDPAKLTASLGAITVLFGELSTSMVLVNKFTEGSTIKLKGVIAFAGAILLLSYSLKKISEIEDGKILSSLGAITVILGELTGIEILLSRFSGTGKTSALGVIGFAIGIYILVSSLKKLGELNVDVLKKGVISLAAVMGELAALMTLTSGDRLSVGDAIGIILVSSALLILQKAVSKFGEMNLEKLRNGLIGVGAILGEIAAFTILSGKSEHILKTAVSLVIMAEALQILQKPFVAFGSMKLPEIGKALLAMGGALGELVAAMKLMPKNTISLSIGLIATGTALILISKAVTSFGNMSWEEIGKGLVTLGGSLGILAGALKLMKGNVSGSVSLIIMATGLMILTPILKELGSLKLEEIGKGLLALGGSLGILAGALKLMKGNTSAAISLIVMATAISILAPALKELGSLNIGEIGTALVTLALTMGLIAGAGYLLAPVSGIITKFAISLSFLLFALTALIIALSGTNIFTSVISPLTEMPDEILSQFLKNIGIMIASIIVGFIEGLKDVAVSIVNTIVELAPTIIEGVLTVIEQILAALVEHGPTIVTLLFDFLIGIINAIAPKVPELVKAAINLIAQFFKGVADALNGVDTGSLLKGIVGIGILAGIMTALSTITGLIPGAMAGVLGAGIIIAEIAGVLAAVGALGQIPGLKWLIDEGGEMLQSIGTALGKLVGGLIGGIASGFTAQLPVIGADLSLFMDNIQPFLDGASKIKPDILKGVNSLAGTILLLTGAELLQGLTSWLTGGFDLIRFGQELAGFGPYFSKFAEQVKDVDTKVVVGTANAAKAISEMARTLPNQGGIVSWITGDNKLSVFGKELAEFAPYLAEYGETVKNVDPKVVETSANAAKAISEMAANLPNQGGLISWFKGDNRLSQFGKELAEFAPYLAEYADKVKNADPAVVEASASAAQVMADMAHTLPDSGGLQAKIFGDNRLSVFGKELAEFGPYIMEYANSVSGLDVSVVNASASAAKALSELASGLPDSGGLKSWIFGDNDIGDFGKGLRKFGEGLSGYYESIAGIDPNTLSSILVEVEKLIDIVKGMEGYDFYSSLSNFSDGLGIMAYTGLDNFTAAFVNSEETINNAISAMVGYAKDSLNSGNDELTEASRNLSASICLSFQTGLTLNQTKFQNEMKMFSSEMVKSLKSSITEPEVMNIGQNMIEYLTKGVNAKSSSALNTIYKLCRDIIDKFVFTLSEKEMGQIGQNTIRYIENGSISGSTYLINTINMICENMIQKIKSILTAKRLNTIGFELVYNLSIGISTNANLVISTIQDLCYQVVNTCRNVMDYSTFNSIGSNATQGLVDGLNSKLKDVKDTATNIANAAAAAAKKALDEKSPSKIFRKIGAYGTEGLAIGLTNNIGLVEDASVKVSKTAVDMVKDSISRILDMIGDKDMSSDLVLTPKVDLSYVQDSVKDISDLFNYAVENQNLNVSAVAGTFNYKKAEGEAESDTKSDDSKELLKKMTDLENRPNVENTFYVTGNNPDEIAEKVSIILQKQYTRSRAAWE